MLDAANAFADWKSAIRQTESLRYNASRDLEGQRRANVSGLLEEGVFAEVWFPAAEFFLEEEGYGQNFVFFPWAADNLHAFWQPGGGAAHADNSRRPAEQVEKGGVGVIEEA